MTEKATSFRILTDKVIAQLESLGYKDNTIINYRRSYNRIATYLEERVLLTVGFVRNQSEIFVR